MFCMNKINQFYTSCFIVYFSWLYALWVVWRAGKVFYRWIRLPEHHFRWKHNKLFCFCRRDMVQSFPQLWLLYQSIHVSVASSTSVRFFQLLRCITSFFKGYWCSLSSLSYELSADGTVLYHWRWQSPRPSDASPFCRYFSAGKPLA